MHSAGQRHAIRITALLCLAGVLAGPWHAQAQPTILSVSPPDGTTGVSTTASVVFTFSTAMDTAATAPFFLDANLQPVATSQSWSVGNTVLTCSPLTSFPANQTITWIISGQDTIGDPLQGTQTGTFSTSTNGGSGGSGTNAITSFSIGKFYYYHQTSAGAPTLDTNAPYSFSAITSLASNRTATSVALTLPTAAVSNLTELPPPSAYLFVLSAYNTNLTAFDTTFPAGNYSFFVQAATSNQTVVVNLPTEAAMPQPNAPHLTNFVAAQTVNPGQPFVLGWDAFSGGTAADFITVNIGSIYGSPDPGSPGALTGTARTFTIPAGTLQPNTTYQSQITFYRYVGTTNAGYATVADRASYMEFSLVTGTAGAASLVLRNPAYAAPNFSFDILCTNTPAVIVEYKSNLAANVWQGLLTNNSPGNGFHVVAPQASTNRFLFFRARSGP